MADEIEEDVIIVLLTEIRDLLKPEDEFFFTYPVEGGTKTIPKGTTIIDLYEGDVTLGDGTSDKLGDSLIRVKRDYAQSALIVADKPFIAQLDDGGKATINVDQVYTPSHKKFQRVSITVDETTLVQFVASTNPKARWVEAVTRGALLLKGTKFNTSVTANTNIFTASLAPTYSIALFRFYVSMNTAGILSVRRTYAGTTVGENLNGGNTLMSNAAYAFDIIVESGETINLRYDTAATILKLAVVEIGGSI